MGAISPLFQQDNWCGLEKKEQFTKKKKKSGGPFKPHFPNVHPLHLVLKQPLPPEIACSADTPENGLRSTDLVKKNK